jgi:Na+/H+ antiporter NhaD/arsenite permease-like protein
MLQELLWALPFAGLLLGIAILPILTPHWWEKHHAKVSAVPALVIAARYLFWLRQPSLLTETAHEYLSFIILIGSLFIISGGIYLQTRGETKPFWNVLFLLGASLTANILGTTGASAIFIRPWIRMNKYRFTGFHLVFFIFLISNVAGGLTPIGDPPLFLGYIKGIPFFWFLPHVWPMWAVTMTYLLLLFYLLDSVNFRKAPEQIRVKETEQTHTFKLRGKRNVFFLAVIIGSVFIERPIFLREGLMIAASLLSYRLTPKDIHQANDFNFRPIREVAVLFFGIFLTMIPALEWLEKYAGEIGIKSAGQFYWTSGALSSILDNAPTFLNFLSLQIGLLGPLKSILSAHPLFITAISVSTVYFGAMTYIGNGPNLLVKSIAEHAKIKTPHFFEFIYRYSLPVLLPIFTVVWFFFFR